MTSYSCRSESAARTTARSANSLPRRLLFGIIGSACFGRGAACCAPTLSGPSAVWPAASRRSRRSCCASAYKAARSPRSYLRMSNRRSPSAQRSSSIPSGESWRSIQRFTPHRIVPRPRSPRSGSDGKPPTWSERLQALKYVPPLLKLVYHTHRGYTVAILALRAFRSFIPLAVLWIGKLIIDGVIAAMQGRAAGAVVDWWALGSLVALELGIAVGGEGMARLSSLFESLLGDLFSNRISVRLMQHAATLDLAQYEDAETYDHLERARRQTVGRIGLVALLLATAQDLVTLVSLAGVLLVQLPC